MNRKHLAILKKGVEKWNKWRKQNPVIKPDLRDAYLYDADLRNANLRNTDLRTANLFCADLSAADLSAANLRTAYLHSASLHSANLRGADLRSANLCSANLRAADLRKADLNRADLSEADLNRADLSDAKLSFAIFIGSNFKNVRLTNCVINQTIFCLTDLSTCKGIDTIRVSGECSIDFQTLRASKNISKNFLFRIGLPQNYIDYLPSFFIQNPIQLSYSVFLSHSSENREFADMLYKYLTSNGVHVWYDEREIRPGDKKMEKVEKGIELYDKLILVCSEDFLSHNLMINKILLRAAEKEKTLKEMYSKKINAIIPIKIDDYIEEGVGENFNKLREYEIGDFTNWQDEESFKVNTFLLKEAINANRQTFIPPSLYDT